MSSMKCHYEVLGVQRDAGPEDFKRSYRKLALKWHPDKNPNNIEEATEQFRIVQQAYDVLGDPQEKAWYDKHREAILKGGMGHGDKYDDDSFDVFQYFNSSCYRGFGDDEKGFYTVYNEVFTSISEEDRQYMDEEDFKFHGFGNSSSVFEEIVKPFYDEWENYCTAKSYVWEEKYDTREAPDRRVRRLMEAENKKLRDAARKERSDEVRALVKFVKKRDKRVQEYTKKLEERALEIKRKSKENRNRQLLERQKLLENFEEAAWSSAAGLEHHYRTLEADYDQRFNDRTQNPGNSDEDVEEEEEEIYDDLFCVACNKMFKSDKAFINHERSKKHKESVALLRAEMQAEEKENDNLSDSQATKNVDLSTQLEDEDGEEEEEIEAPQKLSKKQKKKRKQRNAAKQTEESLAELATEENLDDVSNKLEDQIDELSVSDKATVEDRLEVDSQSIPSETVTGESQTIPSETVAGESQTIPSETVAGESQTVQDTEISGTEQKINAGPDTSQKSGRCNSCKQEFSSRSKLFEHLKQSGHAQKFEQPQPETGKKGKKKKGKR